MLEPLKRSTAALALCAAASALSTASATASNGILSYASSALDRATCVTLRKSGSELVLSDDATRRILARAPAASTRKFVMRGLDGAHDDTLTVDVTGLVLPDGIDYDGGAGGFDSLKLVGSGIARMTQDPVRGVLQLDTLQIRYTNLEPVIDSVPAATLTITGTAAAEAISITDGAAGFTRVQIGSNEYIEFQNKATVIIDGAGGGDTVTINNLHPATGWTTLLLTNVGTVRQTGALQVPNVAVNASGNIDLTWSNPNTGIVENLISAFAATSSGGNVNLQTTGPTQIATVQGVAGVSAPAGRIQLSMAIGSGQNMTVNSNISAGGGSLTVPAVFLQVYGSLLTNNANIASTAGNRIALAAGKMNLAAGTINAGTGAVVLDTMPQGYAVNIGSTTDLAANTVELSNAELNTITADSIVIGDQPWPGAGAITISAPITIAHANWFGLFSQDGGYSATGAGSVTVPHFFITDLYGTTARTWTITGTSVQAGSGTPIPFTASTFGVNGGGGADTFNVTPSATVPITVSGGFPAAGTSPGDVLSVDLTGTTSPVLALNSGPKYYGTYSFGNRQSVTFSSFESVIAPDLVVTKTLAGADALGNVTYALRVTNSGTLGASSVALNDPLPAGTTFVSLAQTSGPAFSCTTPAVGASGSVNCSAGSLAIGASAGFNLVLQRGSLASLTNTASASSFEPDIDTSNNSASAVYAISVPNVAIPTLNEWGMLLVGLTVALLGMLAVRKR